MGRPDLGALAAQFGALKVEAADVVRGLDEDEFNRRPARGGWSVGECLDHLNVAAARYLPEIELGLARARAEGTGATVLRYGLLGRLFLGIMEPPARIKAHAPPGFAPRARLSLREVTEQFARDQERFAALLRSAGGLDLTRAEVASPVSARLRFNLGEAFAVNAAHGRRHLWQARRARAGI